MLISVSQAQEAKDVAERSLGALTVVALTTIPGISCIPNGGDWTLDVVGNVIG